MRHTQPSITRLRQLLAASLVALSLGLAACGSDDGGSTASTTPTTPTTPASTGTLSGTVSDFGNAAGLAGVTVSAGGVSTTSTADGTWTLANVPTAASVVVSFRRDGYVEQIKTTTSLGSNGATATVNTPMLAVAATSSFNPANAATVTVSGSTAAVVLPAGALRTASGALPSGTVSATLTPIPVTDNLDVMPGNFTTGGGERIESFGAIDVAFTDSTGAPLNLASGQTATVRIPVSTRSGSTPSTIPLFYFNRATGAWVQEGTASLVSGADGSYYEGSVSHFSIWNADQVYNSVNVIGCVQDEAGARVADASVTSEGRDYSGTASTRTDASGNFSVPMKANANGVITAVTSGRYSSAVAVETGSNTVTLPACLVLTRAAVTVKLSWGSGPSDLDSHMWGPRAGDHIYYSSKGSLSSAPYVALDVDDTDSFGPEIVTVGRLVPGQTYRYAVNNYSRSFNPGMTSSPARVELNLNGTLRSFTPPAGETASTYYWWVFDLVVDSNCNVNVVRKDVWSSTPPDNPNITAPATLTYCN